MTLGADGCLWIDAAGTHRIPAFEVEIVDSLAAGDVWHAAVAVALGEGRDFGSAAAFANAAAALKCQRPGGRRGAPARSEVAAFLASRS